MWLTLFGAGVLYELHELRDPVTGRPLSKVVRAVGRTHTRAGRVGFLLGWGAFASWFAVHILDSPLAKESS